MYSLLIAEDELVMRRSLVNMIKWNELGFRVDGVFSDGQDLLEYMKISMPDVILTDIKMSGVTGVEVARFVAEQNLPVRVLFLSGYRDFSFAQRAIEYRVFHYLLKPVSVPKIREVFTTLRDMLDRQNSQQNAMLDRVEHYQKLINYQRQAFVIDAWTGVLGSEQQIKQRLQLLNNRCYAKGDTCLFLVRLTLHCDACYWEFLKDYGVQELQEQMESILGLLDLNFEYYPIEWRSSESVRGIYGVGVFWKKEKGECDDTPSLSMCQLKKEFQEKVHDQTGLCAEMAVLKEMNSPEELVFSLETMESVKSEKIFNGKGFECVMGYIQTHYCEDITLADIGKNVFLNPIYISRIIREKTGRTYTELLMELRIEKALDLLKHTDMYVYEIAQKVGYGNLKYFYKVFKRVKGNSPNDYRQKK